MAGLPLIRQTEESLNALKDFAQQSHNAQLLDHVQRLETSLGALAATADMITVGDVSGSTAVAIGHDINIIVNQVLPPDVRQPLEKVQKGWSAAHLEVRRVLEDSQGGHVFLSYTRADMEEALKIRRALEAAGHVVWQDLTAIKGGDEWIKSIEIGVERSYALITVVSEDSQKSEWVQIEYLHAKRRGKLIIPIKIDESEIPTILLATNVIHGHPDLGSGIKQLLRALPVSPPIESTANRRELELRYLDALLLEHSVWQEVYTPMAGVGQLCAPGERPEPDKVNSVRMKTTPTTIDVGYLGRKFGGDAHHEELPEIAQEKQYEADIIPAVEEMRQLVILGDPGAGKTTTLWKILSDCALKAKVDPSAPLPVFVRLGALGEFTLEEQIRKQLGPAAAYYATLLDENRLVFLLDGLNELTAARRDAHLREIRALLEDCWKANMVAAVTCRELDYTGALDLGLPGQAVILELDPIRIQQFVNAYIEESGKGDELFWQLAGENALKRWEDFNVSVGEPSEVFWLKNELAKGKKWGYINSKWVRWLKERQHPRSMLALAANPYMLFMITQVFTRTGVLPRNRGLLFQTFIDYLLEQREQLSEEAAKELKSRLADLAYAMQKEGEGTSFASASALAHLQSEASLYHARSASLLSGSETVRFTHQLLQEYFAAHHLQKLMESKAATELFPLDAWWQPQGWEETLILLAGLYSDDCSPVLRWLQEAQPELAARCIVESGASCPDKRLEELRAAWLPRLSDPKHHARAAIGRALGRLQLDGQPLDNRKGVSLISVGEELLPDIDWVEIPSGSFTYQDDETREEALFYMARYPITYAQFQTFLDDANGFRNPRWWDRLAADEEHRHAAGDQDFKFSNHPRENVSWYEAVAFCRWLTDKAQHHPELLPEALNGFSKCLISLPTERQWEKGARGVDAREYPYAGDFDASTGNTSETDLGQTSAVGVFPQGASPYGLLDMSGNVWEWCLNEYNDPEKNNLENDYFRVLRGGSWLDYHVNARASYRDHNNYPDYRNLDLGFRVVVRPPSL
jgi:formylglycine-generating enzyme required for sulfatase activity